MAIRKHSKISKAIIFNYLYICLSCSITYLSRKKLKRKKCSKCGEKMTLSSAIVD